MKKKRVSYKPASATRITPEPIFEPGTLGAMQNLIEARLVTAFDEKIERRFAPWHRKLEEQLQNTISTELRDAINKQPIKQMIGQELRRLMRIERWDIRNELYRDVKAWLDAEGRQKRPKKTRRKK